MESKKDRLQVLKNLYEKRRIERQIQRDLIYLKHGHRQAKWGRAFPKPNPHDDNIIKHLTGIYSGNDINPSKKIQQTINDCINSAPINTDSPHFIYYF